MTDERTRKIERILPLIEEITGQPELDVNGDPVGELVATILSQNTTDANSRRAYATLKERFSMWAEVRDAAHEDVEDAIQTSGLAPTKTQTIQSALTRLETAGGEPSLSNLDGMTDDDAIRYLSSFKGVGVKTAACVLVFALGRDVCPVDTHVHRVSNRLGLVKTTARDKTFTELAPIIPKGEAYRAHVALVRFGRLVCASQRPKCHVCPLFDECGVEERHDFAAYHNARDSN
ncbi:MAG: endonuclease III [Candidatus Poribacteria bacterium]|nr:endonuclease III [Candidatus Poribacteria bacterium]